MRKGFMRRSRVCAITSDCYPADPLVRRTAEAAVGGEYEYHVICSLDDGQQREELYNGVYVHRICIKGRNGRPIGRITGMPFAKTVFLWCVFACLAAVKIARLHLAKPFEVVHVHNLPDVLVFSTVIPKCLGAKVILHVQDTAPELMRAKSRGLFRKLTVPLAQVEERLSTWFADHVITVGWPFERLLEKRGVRREKISILLNSADPGVFPAEKRTELFMGDPTAARPLILMYHGTFAERCGIDIAIRALAEAQKTAPYIRLHLMGGGESLPRLQELVQRLELKQSVLFLPSRPPDAVADYIAAGDIGIIPYRSDGFMDLVLPTKAYEFAWMRRPMIASNLVGTRSMFRPRSIRLCEPENIASFADAIIDLYFNPQKRADLVANAEQDYQQYRWEVSAERYRQLIASLVQQKRSPAGPRTTPLPIGR